MKRVGKSSAWIFAGVFLLWRVLGVRDARSRIPDPPESDDDFGPASMVRRDGRSSAERRAVPVVSSTIHSWQQIKNLNGFLAAKLSKNILCRYRGLQYANGTIGVLYWKCDS
jgi:hypothetical protein